MKHLKLFQGFSINEANEESNVDTGKVIPEASITSDGKLTINANGTKVVVQMKNIQTFKDKYDNFSGGLKALNQKSKKWFDVDMWILPISEFRNQLSKHKFTTNAYDYTGKSLNDENRQSQAYLFVGVPKGFSGQIKGDSSKINNAEVIGTNSGKGGMVFSAPSDTNWGFYFFEEYMKDHQPENVFRKIQITKSKKDNKVPATEYKEYKEYKIDGKDAFDFDKFVLKDTAKQQINKIAEAGIKRSYLLTGASQDADPKELINKNGKKIKRSQWDSYLVKKRYEVLVNYMKEKGINTKVSKKGKNEKGFNVYGVFDKNNLKNPQNRAIVIKPAK